MKKVAFAAAFSALSLAPAASWALGLGRLNVQSALGEPLRAEIDITSISADESGSLQARVASPETYRAAGVDFNPVLGATNITLQRRADGRSYLRLVSDRAVTEPFVDAILDLAWSSGRLVREYTLLFDPPAPRSSTSQMTAPVMDAPPAPAPAPAPAQVPAPAPVAAPAAQTPAPAPARAPQPQRPVAKAPAASVASAPARAPAPKPAEVKPAAVAPSAPAADNGGRSVRVRPGDSLSQIAERTLTPGVALDQMIVGLYRSNPQAFVGDNMNRLKSGVVLNVPGTDKTTSTSPAEAHQIIVAQSADFAAFRQRMAAGVTETVAPKQQRQAAGKVEAEVQDRKQSAAPAPDKLTLSKGGLAAGKQPAAEDRLAKDRAQKDSGTRVAELSRNLDDLRKLKEKVPVATAPVVASKPAPAPAPVPKPAPVPAPAPVAKPAPAPAPVPKPAPAPVPVPAPVVASKPAPAPVPAPKPSVAEPAKPAVVASAVAVAPSAPASVPASAADMAASGAATSVADTASAASSATDQSMVPTLPKPVQIPVPEPEPEAPGFFQSVNPALLAGAGAVVALIAAAGLYLRSRRRPDGAETSFLESRLQPDSFFGASGGQRVDTRDATGGPSSMSYSLSQLDAIGDVDPVAEADVYLAYGRDLQAEEILKEALRSNPDRLSIRTKLLEVYAKRRDTKGFEQLAVQLYGLTGGQGDEWLHTQEMGLGIDPENPLYQPGGQPVSSMPAEQAYQEPLGASTVPLSEMPPLHEMEPIHQAQPVDDMDLDLDISVPAEFDDEPLPATAASLNDLPPLEMPEASPAPSPAPAPAEEPDLSLDFDLPEVPAPAPAVAAPAPTTAPAAEFTSEPTAPAPLAFDMASISLDLGEPESAAPAAAGATTPAAPAAEEDPFADGALSVDESSDPLARKLELAEEFRHIGDVDGARELLQEVIATAEGATRAKAQAMLDNLN